VTAYQNAIASMFGSVHGFVTSPEAQPVLADLAPAQTCIAELGTQIETLDRLVAVQNDKSGFAQEKAKVRSAQPTTVPKAAWEGRVLRVA
jgi:hypothetical protein